MSGMSRRHALPAWGGCALAATVLLMAAAGPRAADSDEDAALKRTRDHVQMLDALYKNAVVSITNKYDGPPAIRVAKDVFGAMQKAGYHDAKLVDATGTPLNEANLPQSDFEKRAAEAIRSGKPYYDEVVGQGDQRTLKAATVVPAVLNKCAKCHGVKEGELLGFIRYELPVK